jgi:hypothetical protein
MDRDHIKKLCKCKRDNTQEIKLNAKLEISISWLINKLVKDKIHRLRLIQNKLKAQMVETHSGYKPEDHTFFMRRTQFWCRIICISDDDYTVKQPINEIISLTDQVTCENQPLHSFLNSLESLTHSSSDLSLLPTFLVPPARGVHPKNGHVF